MPETNVVSDQILNSWKEIASYLNRGVRTVQRWESELGLPVRRPRGRRRSAVIAMRTEIDVWLNHCPLEAREAIAASEMRLPRTVAQRAGDKTGNGGLSELILNSRLLRQDLDRSRAELQGVLARLMGTIQEYRVLLQDLPETKPAVEEFETLDIAGVTRVA